MKKILLTIAVLVISACGKDGGSSNNVNNGTVTTQGGVVFQTNQPITLCAGGAITIQNGTMLTWAQVHSYFGGFADLKQREMYGSLRIVEVLPTYNSQYPNQQYGGYNGGYGNSVSMDTLLNRASSNNQYYYSQNGQQQQYPYTNNGSTIPNGSLPQWYQ